MGSEYALTLSCLSIQQDRAEAYMLTEFSLRRLDMHTAFVPKFTCICTKCAIIGTCLTGRAVTKALCGGFELNNPPPKTPEECFDFQPYGLTRRNLEFRIRNAYWKVGIENMPSWSLNLQNELEIHSGGGDEITAKAGFIYLREGYFCSVWALPESMLK